MKESTFVMDVDGTICVAGLYADGTPGFDYENAQPILPVIRKIKELKAEGHTIIINTARGMRTYDGNVLKIKEKVLPTLIKWLKKHDVPYDEIFIGKPWGPNVFYVDDKSLSPADFAWRPTEEFEQLTNTKFVKP